MTEPTDRASATGRLARRRTPIHAVARNRDGAIAMIFALLAIPLIMVIGAATDYTRLEYFKTRLQATVDSAALSGAAVYSSSATSSNATTVAGNYLTANEALLPPHSGSITSSVSAAQVTTGNNQGYAVTVSATGKIVPSFMRILYATIPVSATAVAINPPVSINVDATDFNSDAGDTNTIWYYLVPSDGSTPNPSTFTSSQKIASNVGTNPSSFSIPASSSSTKVGFALQNTTGTNSGWYGCTQYEEASTPALTTYAQCYGHEQWFFSTLSPPSDYSGNVSGYTAVTQNCSLQTKLSSSAPANNTPPVTGSCFSSLPTDATFSCAELTNTYITYYWNDMGWYTDDKDYNDFEYTLSCSGSSTSNNATNVYLAQ